MKPGAVALLLVLCATLLTHAAAKDGEFVFFDDGRFVTENPAITEAGNPLRFFTDVETVASPDKPTKDIYRPIRTWSFALITQWWGRSDAKAFHAVSVSLHAACAVLLAAVLMAAGLKAWPAAAGALFWSLHPATVEVSAWVCSLGDIWCGLFSLLAVLLYAKARGVGGLVGAHVALVLALFSKEHAVVVPVIWLAWDFFLRRDEWRAGLKRAVAPGLAIVIGFLILRGSLGIGMSQRDEPLGGSHLEALTTMLSGMGWYLSTILLPSGPTFQARVEPSAFGVIVGLAVVAGLVALVLRAPRRFRLGAAWFLIALAPVSNLLIPLKIPTADRFLYLPLMGCGVLVAELCRRWRPAAWAAPAALLILAGVTQARIGDWSDSDSLYEAGIRVDRKSPMLVWYHGASRAERAVKLLQAGRFEQAGPLAAEAVQDYRRYLRQADTSRDTIQVWMELGTLLYEWGTWAERLGNRPEYVRSYADALTAFATAHELQIRGEGRVIESDVRLAAEMAAKLCVRMAEPSNPYMTRAIALGERMLRFLDARFKAPVGMRFVQLRLAYIVSIRADDPSKARRGLNQLLTILDAEEKRGAYTKFLRGQVLMYRGILLDKPASRTELERAARLFSEVEEEVRETALQARLQQAKAYCAMAKVLMDEPKEFRVEMAKRGRALIEDLPNLAKEVKRKISPFLKKQMDSEHRGCLPR